MQSLTYLMLYVGIVFYFYFVVRNVSVVEIRTVLTAAGCFVILMLPSHLQRFRLGTMVACSASFMACLELQYLMLHVPDHERTSWSLKDFCTHLQQAMLPITYVPHEKRRHPARLIRDSLLLVARACAEMFMTNVFWLWLVTCLGGSTRQVEEDYLLDVIYSSVFFLHMMTGAMFSFNMQRALLSLCSLDRLSILQYYREPLLAASPRDFWSRRWNLVLRNVLHTTVFTPVRKAHGSPTVAAFSVFVIGGIMHVYLVWVVFGTRMLEAFCFFLIHGVACLIETVFVRKFGRLPKPFCNIATLVFIAWTAPFYMGTFMRFSPQWLPNNAPDVIIQLVHHIPLPSCPAPQM